MSGHLLDPLRNTAQPTVLFCGAGFSVGTGGGLGLAIVRDIALLHGDELTVANRPAHGLCTMLRLPRRSMPWTS